MVLRNFRAQDFEDHRTGGKSEKREKPAKKAPAKKAAAKVEEPVDPNAVPEGTIDEIEQWIGTDRDRAVRALEAENKKDKPRKTGVETFQSLIEMMDEASSTPEPAEARETASDSEEEAK